MSKKKVTLAKGIELNCGTIVPKGTKVTFGTEGYGYYAGKRINMQSIPGVESMETIDVEADAPILGETVVGILQDKYPDGFTEEVFGDDLGDIVNAEIEGDDLVITAPNGAEIKIELEDCGDGKFKATGEVELETKDVDDEVGVESWLGQLKSRVKGRRKFGKK